MVKPKLSIIVGDGLANFLEWVEYITDDYDVTVHKIKQELDVVNALHNADIVWFEFANEAAIHGTKIIEDNVKSGMKKPVVIARLHGYEAFNPVLLPSIKWNTLDRLVYVSPANLIIMNDYHAELFKTLESRMVKILNGVNLDRHPFKEREHGMNIGLIGYLNNKKNSQMSIEIIRSLASKGNYVLHIAGEYQDRAIESYVNYAIKENELQDNIMFHGWLSGDKMNELWDSLNYILCTSITESFGYNIAEAMARGIKPVIHDFIGSRQIWPDKYIFCNYKDAFNRIAFNGDRYNSKEYREYIEDNYNLKTQVHRIKELLNEQLTKPEYTRD